MSFADPSSFLFGIVLETASTSSVTLTLRYKLIEIQMLLSLYLFPSTARTTGLRFSPSRSLVEKCFSPVFRPDVELLFYLVELLVAGFSKRVLDKLVGLYEPPEVRILGMLLLHYDFCGEYTDLYYRDGVKRITMSVTQHNSDLAGDSTEPADKTKKNKHQDNLKCAGKTRWIHQFIPTTFNLVEQLL